MGRRVTGPAAFAVRESRIWLAAAALLAAAAGCGRPTRVVVEPTPAIVASTRSAVAALEDLAGCRLWLRVDIGGTARDWRGALPPLGTVTIQVSGLRRYGPDKVGETVVGARPRARIRVLPRVQGAASVLAHELGHSLGFGHEPDGIMRPKVFWELSTAVERTSDDWIERLKGKCL